jgi:16S rRNA (guanine527-N7)-methyltransferase
MDSQGLMPKRLAIADFWTSCTSNGIMLNVEQLHHLERFEQELRYWNAKVNMISRKDEENIWEKHILHSLTLLKYITMPPKARVLDVGTGGGLPGVPLKIARPDIKLVLVDSIGKKLKLAEMFAKHTGHKDILAHNQRCESLAQVPHYRSAFSVVVSRAVTGTSELLTWVAPLVRPGAVCAFLKGGDLLQELHNAQQQFPQVAIAEHPIDWVGVPGFSHDDKKVVVCTFPS